MIDLSNVSLADSLAEVVKLVPQAVEAVIAYGVLYIGFKLISNAVTGRGLSIK